MERKRHQGDVPRNPRKRNLGTGVPWPSSAAFLDWAEPALCARPLVPLAAAWQHTTPLGSLDDVDSASMTYLRIKCFPKMSTQRQGRCNTKMASATLQSAAKQGPFFEGACAVSKNSCLGETRGKPTGPNSPPSSSLPRTVAPPTPRGCTPTGIKQGAHRWTHAAEPRAAPNAGRGVAGGRQWGFQ